MGDDPLVGELRQLRHDLHAVVTAVIAGDRHLAAELVTSHDRPEMLALVAADLVAFLLHGGTMIRGGDPGDLWSRFVVSLEASQPGI